MNLFTLTATGGSAYSGIIMMVILFAMFYFMLIRPQRKKDKEVKEMRSSLKVGDKVVTIGGIRGKIVKISDEIIDVELPFNKQKITIEKWAIGSTTSTKDAKDEDKKGKKDSKDSKEEKAKKIETKKEVKKEIKEEIKKEVKKDVKEEAK